MSSSSVATPEPAKAKQPERGAEHDQGRLGDGEEQQQEEHDNKDWAIDMNQVKSNFEEALKTTGSATASPAAQEYHEEQRKFLDELLQSERKASSTRLSLDDGKEQERDGAESTADETGSDGGNGNGNGNGNGHDVTKEGKRAATEASPGSGALIMDAQSSSGDDEEEEDAAAA